MCLVKIELDENLQASFGGIDISQVDEEIWKISFSEEDTEDKFNLINSSEEENE